MPTTSVKIIGEKELLAKFHALQKQTQGKMLVQAATAGILPIQSEAVLIVVKVTGNLSRSIHTETIETGDTYAEVATGTDLDYAAAVEFGLPEHNRIPKPYMRPSFDTKTGAAKAETQAALMDLINAVVG